MRPTSSFMVVLLVAFVVAACTSRSTNGAAQPTAVPTALSAVAAAPLVSPPAWIASVSPHDEAPDGAQIRVRFANDLIPVEALEAPDRAQVLAHFTIAPALPGRFILLTPRMVAFEADAPLPHAARVRITLTAGLADRAGHILASDYAWSFTTEPLTFSGLPGSEDVSSEPLPGPLRPRIGVDASDAVDVTSLLAHARLVDQKNPADVATLEIAPSPSPGPAENPLDDADDASDANGPDLSDTSVHYDLEPTANLAYDTSYKLFIDPGVAPLGGNVPSAGLYSGRLRTYGPLTFESADLEGGGRFAGGVPTLTFSNDIDPTTAAAAISLSPAPNPNLPLVRADENGTVAIDSDALEPDTHYTVTIAKTLADVFGQKLANDAVATFDTGDLAPDIWAPDGLSVFPAQLKLAVNVDTTNLPFRAFRSAFALVHPVDLIANDVSTDAGARSLLPAKDDWKTRRVQQQRNRELDTAVPLSSVLSGPTGMFAYGFTARTTREDDNGKVSWDEPDFTGAVLLTDIGLFTQWFPDSGIVRANHLSDGSPIAGAHVDIYESYTDITATPSGEQTPCASGTTGADGAWRLNGAAFAACASLATDADEPPGLLAIAHVGNDWSFARTSPYLDGYSYGLDNEGWSAGTPLARGALVSDRSLYQPGETVKFAGIAYFEIDGVLRRGRSASYVVTLHAPSGATHALGRAVPDAYGAFSLSVPLDKRAEVGDWTIAAVGDGGEELDGDFTVAEFKPPNFKVDLTLDTALTSAGSSVNARSTSTYLFGAPVEGAVSHLAVTRAPDQGFTPNGWDAFSFGRQWLYPEDPPDVSPDVLQTDIPIDANGNAAAPVPVATDLPYPMTYTVSAETTDVSRLAVADTKTFVALPADSLIGLRSNFVAASGKPFSVDVIVTDPQGAAQSGRAVKLVLQQRLDASVTQIVEGSDTDRADVRYVDVATQNVTSGAGPVTVQFTASKPGEYRIRANFAGAASDVTATDAEIWVAGAEAASWLASENGQLPLKLDKAAYRPGDVATVLIESPFPDAQLYFSVVRHGVLYETSRVVHGSAPQISFRITPEMLPNAAAEAVLVRRGPPLQRGVPARLSKLSQIGFATFDVALDSKYVKVALRPQHTTLEPGSAQHLTLHLSDAHGDPARGEIVVAVVNDAILQLSGYRFPDLVKAVYADQVISTRVADTRNDVKLETAYPAVEKGFGFGGGVMPGPPNTRVRTAFVPLAYWNASVHTDAGGNAAVNFRLPDDLTTWRVMALALTADARFGSSDTTFVATKPLVSNPVLPQFARPGDRFAAGVAVTNVARHSGTVGVRAAVTGGATFASGDPHVAATTAPSAGASEAYRFDVLVSGTQHATFTFRTDLAGRSDAFRFSVPVLADDILESVVTTGTTRTTASIPLDVASNLRGPLGGLEVTLASTLLSDTIAPAEALERPDEPFATTLAARIAVASDEIVLDRLYGKERDVAPLQTSVRAALDALEALRLPDGGFAEWPGAEKSEVYSTAFVVEQLLQAERAGFEVGHDVASGDRYLETVLANPIDRDECAAADATCIAEGRLEALETIDAAGEARNDFLGDIVAREKSLSYYERVELARLLLRLPAWVERGDALRDELFENVNLGARHATVVLGGEFGESEVDGQAQMLGLAIAGGTAREDVDRLLESLLALRHNGVWGCECDDAEAMNALVSYALQDTTPPSFIATAQLPAVPRRTFAAAFEGYTHVAASTVVPIGALLRGHSAIALAKRGSGTLHYTIALQYQTPPESPGVYEGLRIDRILRPAGERQLPLASLGIALPSGPTTVAPARVYDVEDRIVTDHPVDNVLVTDPLPAGFEAVDETFRTAAPETGELTDEWEVTYQAIYRDRVLTFADHLDPGAYAIHYLVRSVTSGTFSWPGATVELQYEPEQFGRTAASQLVVTN